MKGIIDKVKRLNRKRNLATTRLKIKIRMLMCDDFSKNKTRLRPEKTKSVVILMYGSGIGDAIIMTGLIKKISDAGIKVSVIAELRTGHIFENLPFIKNIYIISKTGNNDIACEEVKNNNYDALIDVDDISHHSPAKIEVIKKCNAKHVIGINQFSRVFDTSIRMNLKSVHISAKHKAVARLLGMKAENMNYHICLNNSALEDTKAYLRNFNVSKIIILNPYGTEESRTMSFLQINEICRLCHEHYGVTPFIIGAQEQIKRIPQSEHHVIFPLPEFAHAAAIISFADVVISPDTSIVHLCKSLNKKLVCIYNNKVSHKGVSNNILYGPDYDNALQIFSPGKRVDEASPLVVFEHIKQQLS
ncbi:glycosyltransferase family 9 protein [Enterobacter ludwigii]